MPHRTNRTRRTDETVCILLQTNRGDEVGTLFGAPVGDDRFGQPIGTAVVAVGGGRVFGGWYVSFGRRKFGLGSIDRRAIVDVALVLVVGIRFGVRRALLEAHGGGEGDDCRLRKGNRRG